MTWRSSEPCERLDWDSEFFGFPIAAVRVLELDPARADAIDQWAAEHGIRCLYLFADPRDVATVYVAGQRGYALADVRIDYEVGTARADEREWPPPVPVRAATEADVPALKAIARVSHRDTRFYRDPHFPKDRCDALYEHWIERSCEGWAERVFVAGPEGNPAGYVTVHGDGRIGLVAVRDDCRGRGVGRAMFDEALHWLSGRGLSIARVRTQEANVAAKRLYARRGGRIESTSLVFHRWLELPAHL